MNKWKSRIRFRQSVSEQPDSTAGQTSLQMLLIPWIVFWTAPAFLKQAGYILAAGTCAVIPVAFRKNRKTVYDVLSVILVFVFSVFLAGGRQEEWVLPASYFSFGLMWVASCLARIPLTAHYSMNRYGKEAALQNPLFLKTNRILSLLWGLLYLFIAALTWKWMQADSGGSVRAINTALLFMLGLFTSWFQKWYPARQADSLRKKGASS